MASPREPKDLPSTVAGDNIPKWSLEGALTLTFIDTALKIEQGGKEACLSRSFLITGRVWRQAGDGEV